MSRVLQDGPAEYWSAEKGPTPAQWRTLALAALELLGVPEPASRLDATTALVRLRLAADEAPADERPLRAVPAAW